MLIRFRTKLEKVVVVCLEVSLLSPRYLKSTFFCPEDGGRRFLRKLRFMPEDALFVR
jgi:hypothetical protein